jgi:hypothetical protein
MKIFEFTYNLGTYAPDLPSVAFITWIRNNKFSSSVYEHIFHLFDTEVQNCVLFNFDNHRLNSFINAYNDGLAIL